MVQGGERAERDGERGEEKVYGWGARNGALVIQKRAASGERGLRRVREMASSRGPRKGYGKCSYSGNRTPALPRKNKLLIHHMGYN